MGDVFITDMTHFKGIPDNPSYAPARKIAQFFGGIVSAASVFPPDRLIDVALFCRRRPGKVRCPGHLQIRRDNVSRVITWHCSCCDDQGEISNWEGTSWNLSTRALERDTKQNRFELILSEDELKEIKRSLVLSPELECYLYGAVFNKNGIVVPMTPDELEELQDYIAFDANHEKKRSRQNILDNVYEKIDLLLEQEDCDENATDDREKNVKREMPLPTSDRFAIQWESKMNGKLYLSPTRKIIPAEVVEKTWQRVSGLLPKDAKKLISRMKKEQPVILAYVMAVNDDIFDNGERQELLYQGVVVWQIMLQGLQTLPTVTEEILEQAEAGNVKMVEQLAYETKSGFKKAVRDMLNNYKQPEVLRYVIEALMEETEETSPVRDKNKGIMLLDLKTIIDCFNS